MKKILLLMFVVASLMSCTDNSTEGKLKNAFKEYANKNFDDPESLKEIVEINIGADTLNLCEFRDALKSKIEMAYSIDSAYSIMSGAVMGTQNSIYAKAKGNERYRKEIAALIESMINYVSCKEDYRIDLDLTYSKFDSIFTLDTIVVDDKIKCRVNKGNELRLETYISHRDTLFSNIVISKEGAKAEDVYNFYEESNRYLDLSEKLSRQIELGKEALYRFSQMSF